MAGVTVVINNRNLLHWPKAMVECLQEWTGVESIIILDNASTYPSLLEWYAALPISSVIRLPENMGHKALWKSGVVDRLGRYYVVTDPDLDLSNVPRDAVRVMREQLDQYPEIVKVGLSLEYQDLPDETLAQAARKWEEGFWKYPGKDGHWMDNAVDTTLALYDRERENGIHVATSDFLGPAIRLNRPYTARHWPWYIMSCPPEDFIYHCHHAALSGHWTPKIKELLDARKTEYHDGHPGQADSQEAT